MDRVLLLFLSGSELRQVTIVLATGARAKRMGSGQKQGENPSEKKYSASSKLPLHLLFGRQSFQHDDVTANTPFFARARNLHQSRRAQVDRAASPSASTRSGDAPAGSVAIASPAILSRRNPMAPKKYEDSESGCCEGAQTVALPAGCDADLRALVRGLPA